MARNCPFVNSESGRSRRPQLIERERWVWPMKEHWSLTIGRPVTGQSRRLNVHPAVLVNGGLWPQCVPRPSATITSGARVMRKAMARRPLAFKVSDNPSGAPRQKNEVGRFLSIFEEDLARRAHLRTHG